MLILSIMPAWRNNAKKFLDFKELLHDSWKGF